MTMPPQKDEYESPSPLDLSETLKRVAAVTSGMNRESAMRCQVDIHVNFFFDGTNNNRERDRADKSYTNVAVLYDACRDDHAEGYYSFYIPGVGTPFDDIGEYKPLELPAGKSLGTGGDQRINWALIQLLNAIHRRAHQDRPLISDSQTSSAKPIDPTKPGKPGNLVGQIASSLPMHSSTATDNNLAGKAKTFFEWTQAGGLLIPRLRGALRNEQGRPLLPEVTLVRVGVFGFSRGAAQARAFCFFLNRLLDPDQTLAGVRVEVQFLGLFDTVASVGVADAPGLPFHGFGGWANGTMDVPTPLVKRCVHYVAGHEVRHAFPLSGVRIGHAYPKNCTETVYPGAHSDVGGGYAPGSQGKAVGDRRRLLSQIPLMDMYREALIAGVALRSTEDLIAGGAAAVAAAKDLQVHRDTRRLYEAYMQHINFIAHGSERLEEKMQTHLLCYWHWRRLVLARPAPAKPRAMPLMDPALPPPPPGLTTLRSFALAPDQDCIDLAESEGDLIKEIAAFAQSPDRNERARWLQYQNLARRGVLPADVDALFDLLVHDSHAGFYMVGPVTPWDQQRRVETIRQRLAEAANKRNSNLDKTLVAALEGGPPGSGELSHFDRHVLIHAQQHPGGFPLVSDRDRGDLLSLEDLVSYAVLHAATDTRREKGAHLHHRAVFDNSDSVGTAPPGAQSGLGAQGQQAHRQDQAVQVRELARGLTD